MKSDNDLSTKNVLRGLDYTIGQTLLAMNRKYFGLFCYVCRRGRGGLFFDKNTGQCPIPNDKYPAKVVKICDACLYMYLSDNKDFFNWFTKLRKENCRYIKWLKKKKK